KLLEKFDIKVVAHSDRIEMTGLLPTQTFNNKGDRVFCSPCGKRWRVEYAGAGIMVLPLVLKILFWQKFSKGNF
ncbi:MAG: hypothetical protein SVM79_07150, partial [Chloroflexota bacterium]|nr:hypothetical protein [Chloroflexota bacterium]